MQTIDFNTLASQFGTFNKDDLKIGSVEYARKTLPDMIDDVVKALQIAKAELETFDGFNLPIKNAQFKSRMITRDPDLLLGRAESRADEEEDGLRALAPTCTWLPEPKDPGPLPVP